MVNIGSTLQIVSDAVGTDDVRLDLVFQALSDPIRRRILERLDGRALLVSELAGPFEISLQGVSRHIQVLVRAGLVNCNSVNPTSSAQKIHFNIFFIR